MGLTESKERFLFDRRLNVRQVQDCPIYAGMIEQLDQAVGIVLAKLDELGLDDNTIVCFTSDNGGVSSGDAYATSNLPLRGGKGRQWEGGIREPFYIKFPRITKGGLKNSTPVNGIDWYPSILELCGIEIPKSQKVDGVSLVPLLKGKAIKNRSLFWHYPHYGNQEANQALSLWKMTGSLFIIMKMAGMSFIIWEMILENKIIFSKRKIKRSLQMRKKLDTWLKQTNAKFPQPDPKFDSKKRNLRWGNIETKGKEVLEKRHASFLDPNYQPNKDWWGSQID